MLRKPLGVIPTLPPPPPLHTGRVQYRIKNIVKIEYKIAQYNNKLDFHFKKWDVLTDKLNML